MKLAVPMLTLYENFLRNNPDEKQRLDKLRLADRDLADEAAEKAQQTNCLEVTIVMCEDLRTSSGRAPSAYVGYQLPGQTSAATSIVENSVSPVFDDEKVYPISITRDFL